MICLFDFDGTIADSRRAILNAYTGAIEAELGIKIMPDEQHIHDLLRRRPFEYLAQHYGQHAERLESAYASLYDPSVVVPFESMPENVRCLQDSGVETGIVTNKARARLLKDLTQIDLNPDSFTVLICAEDTVERKPNAEPILAALSRTGASPGAAIYVGDAPHDVTAAKAAGVTAYAVCWGYYPAATLSEAGADAIFDEPLHLFEALDRRFRAEPAAQLQPSGETA